MAQWEQEVFEKEYADMNWYKGKQAKHVKEMEQGRKRSKLGSLVLFIYIVHDHKYYPVLLVLTAPQREIFSKVKGAARLAMASTFSARERKFIGSLAQDLHLSLAWDEYDDEDQNLVTWRFPETMVEPIPEQNGTALYGDDSEWEDEEDGEEEESQLAVLKKYERAPVLDDEDGGFDARYEQSVKEKMDEWKRTCYKVRSPPPTLHTY